VTDATIINGIRELEEYNRGQEQSR